MLSQKIVTAVATLFFPFIFSCAAQAASFDCAKARSKQEKLICSTPALSQADDLMAAKYKEAYAAAAKISSQEAAQLKTYQSSWIMTGIEHCTPDVKCLSASYKERISFLDFYLRQSQTPIAMAGTYERNDLGNTGELQVRMKEANKIVFDVSAIYLMNRGTPYLTANEGELAGESILTGNVAKYQKQIETDASCKLQITFSATKAVVEQDGFCGFGLNVSAGGVYFKTSNAVPEIKIDPTDPNHAIN